MPAKQITLNMALAVDSISFDAVRVALNLVANMQRLEMTARFFIQRLELSGISEQRRQSVNKIDYQALRAKAEKATCGEWSLEYGKSRFDGDDALIHREVAGYIPICRIEGAHPESGFDEDFQIEQQANAEFIAAANPATVTALLDELERNQQYIKRRDQENEEIALTVGRLRVELEGKDSKIANLTAERDALREGEMGDARHSNTRAAADIYFQLVEECEIPAGGSLVEYVDDMREKLEAAEKRIAELESGSQAQKLVEAIIVAIENEQERLFDEDYLLDSKECIDVIREEVKRWNDSRAAGIRINGGE